jgi:hypothetical protein
MICSISFAKLLFNMVILDEDQAQDPAPYLWIWSIKFGSDILPLDPLHDPDPDIWSLTCGSGNKVRIQIDTLQKKIRRSKSANESKVTNCVGVLSVPDILISTYKRTFEALLHKK